MVTLTSPAPRVGPWLPQVDAFNAAISSCWRAILPSNGGALTDALGLALPGDGAAGDLGPGEGAAPGCAELLGAGEADKGAWACSVDPAAPVPVTGAA